MKEISGFALWDPVGVYILSCSQKLMDTGTEDKRVYAVRLLRARIRDLEKAIAHIQDQIRTTRS